MMWTRIRIAVLIVLVFGQLPARGQAAPGYPNIVLIVADDFGYGDLSCYGAKKISTPNTDKLAANGMRFTDAYVVSSLCSPSRYSIMTGRYSWRTYLRTGVLKPFSPPLIEAGRVTLASMLRDAGYYTACVGKWHLGFDWHLKDNAPEDAVSSVFDAWGPEPQLYIDFSRPARNGPVGRGFDYFYGIGGSNNMMPYVYIENDRVVQPPSVPNDVGHKTLKAPNWDVRTIDNELTKKAVTVVDDHFRKDDKRPLFLYFATSAIHRPCAPTETRGKSRAGLRGDMVVKFDEMVGEIVEALERNGALNNTLLIVTSDNGAEPGDPFAQILSAKENKSGTGLNYYPPYFENFQPQFVGYAGQEKGWLVYDHEAAGGLSGFKADTWEGGLRVPFIVHWPGRVAPGTQNSNVISTVDLLATLAELTGQRLPENAGEDSYSFLSNLFDSKAPAVRTSLVMVGGRTGALIVRKGRWKYIEGTSTGAPATRAVYPPPANQYPGMASTLENQLYDLENDRAERVNLIDRFPERASELEGIIERVKTRMRSEPR